MPLISAFLAWLVVKDCPAGLRSMVTLAASELSFPLRVDREIYLAKGTKSMRPRDLDSGSKYCSKMCYSWKTSPSQCPTWKPFSQVVSWNATAEKVTKTLPHDNLRLWMSLQPQSCGVETFPVLQSFHEGPLLHPAHSSKKHSCIYWVYQHLPVRKDNSRRVWSTLSWNLSNVELTHDAETKTDFICSCKKQPIQTTTPPCYLVPASGLF